MDHVLLRQFRDAEVFSIDHPATVSLTKLQEMPAREKAQIRLIKGHYAYGLHEHFPRKGIYFTLLRNPISRLISYYYYAKRTPNHYLHRIIDTENYDIQDLFRHKLTSEVDNDQVRRISGVGDTVKFGDCTTEMLETAKENLANEFAVTGLTERFDETLLLLREVFGWKNVFYVRKNVTKSRPRRAALPESQLAAIQEANALDIQLYQWAQEHFETQIQRRRNFQRDLRFFKASNSLYARIYRATARLRGIQT
ncbi:MAG: sulfotransferase family 2 domain-containing protein [Anaerolineales bacterium]|jgi:hypothetical protein